MLEGIDFDGVAFLEEVLRALDKARVMGILFFSFPEASSEFVVQINHTPTEKLGRTFCRKIMDEGFRRVGPSAAGGLLDSGKLTC